MSDAKTVPTGASVEGFVSEVEPAGRREDARLLLPIMRRASGEEPAMWGSGIVGFGQYSYRYDSGHSGSSFLTGFAPRRSNMMVYLMSGFGGEEEALRRLGPHKRGAACLYLGRLGRVDLGVLEDLVRRSVAIIRSRWDS